MDEPAYIRARRTARLNKIKQFILEVVIPEDFNKEKFRDLYDYCSNEWLNNDQRCELVCDYFELGEWFKDALVEVEFDVEDFLCELANKIEEENREASEDYADLQREKREVQG